MPAPSRTKSRLEASPCFSFETFGLVLKSVDASKTVAPATPSEVAWIQKFLADHTWNENQGRPLCLLQPWDKTRTTHFKLAPVEFWDAIVARWRDQFRFWQVGFENDSAVQGCEYYFLGKPGKRRDERRLVALTQQAQAFLGIDAEAMVIAQAFQVPSHILTISALRDSAPEATIQKVDAFFETLLRK